MIGVVFGFTGSGSHDMPFEQWERVYSTFQDGGVALHVGDCIHADEQAVNIARLCGMWIIGHPPSNPRKRAFCVYNEEREPAPYLVRNHNIVDECERLVAAPHGRTEMLRSGTWATIRYARRSGRALRIVWPDGSYTDE